MELSKQLFWDIDAHDFDPEKHKEWIIPRVVMKGSIGDWESIFGYYGEEVILNVVKTTRYLDQKTLNFLSKNFKIPIEEFRCYMKRSSTSPHWNY